MNNVKEFLKSWTDKNLKKMDKDDVTYLLYDNIPSIVSFYIKKGHQDQESVKTLFDRMEGKKFSKTLLRILKTQKETPVELGMAVIVSDFLERRHEKVDQEIIDAFGTVVNKILKKRLKKVSEKTGLDPEVVRELLVVVPDKDVISDKKFVGIYVNKITRKLYAMAKESDDPIIADSKGVKKLFKQIFGEDMLNSIAINLLLERKEFIKSFNEKQQAVWNLLSTYALDSLESNKKKDIKELLGYYISRRLKDSEKNRDGARRIQISQIAKDSYPKITSVVEELSEKDKFKKFL